SPYVGDYAVDGHTILSESEVDGNIIYRINGVIATPPDLTPFQNVSYVSPAPGDSVTTERTVVRKTYRTTAAPEEYPAGTMAPGVIPNDGSQTTTVVHTYTTESP
ncbi:MAG TPA: hypothetical protein VFR09_09465, partial [Alphaproteobacteria bacterium]|nr:hypothetical protein [Alphaproteobacteria bacterium]